jgi:plasmid stability protein
MGYQPMPLNHKGHIMKALIKKALKKEISKAIVKAAAKQHAIEKLTREFLKNGAVPEPVRVKA